MIGGPSANLDRLSWPTRVAAARWPDRPALECGGTRISWADLERRVAARVAELQAGGLERGEPVAVLGPNSLEWVVDAFAIPRAGGVLLPLNTRLAPTEIAHQRELARAVRLGGAHTLMFTSGTSGRPRGAVLSWANHEASVRACIAALDLVPEDRYLVCIPLFHIGGLNILYRMALSGGCAVVQERFDADAVVRAMRLEGVTRVSLTATMLRRVLDAAGSAGIPDSVRTILVGGEPAAPGLLARCRQARATYGLTEACSHVTLADPGDRHTVGRPLPGYEIRIVDPDGAILPPGTPGRIEIRGPAVMVGYLGDSPLDGWLDTGDLGTLAPDGRLTVHARRQDLILSGGENVYPAEIEAALAQHPAVAACAVIGIPDATWGQVPAAVVVPADPEAPPGPADLEAFLRQHLGGYKIPRRWMFADALPRTASGKVDRSALWA